MNIYFSHGKEGSPLSHKMTHLAEIATTHGFTPLIIDYTDSKDPQIRTNKLTALLENDSSPYLLLGSSMGGYVSIMNTSRLCKGVFLFAPALYMAHYPNNDYAPKTDNIVIVHGKQDETVPFSHSEQFAEHFPCTLHELDDVHKMEASLDETSALFEQFLLRVAHHQNA